MLKYTATAIATLCCSILLIAQSVSWTEIKTAQQSPPDIQPKHYSVVAVDFESLKSQLSQAPILENTAVSKSDFNFEIPSPYGEMWTFKIAESPIMAAGLQEKYPNIRTFVGQGTGDYAHASARFDFTLKGFHAQILISGQTYYIDPYSSDDLDLYIVYTREAFYANNTKSIESCEPLSVGVIAEPTPDNHKQVKQGGLGNVTGEPIPMALATNGSQLRTYRLALACTGEYASFHGGTVPLVMSAMITSMNRVNGVFIRDMSLQMIMVDDNDDLIYLNSGTDPYSNTNGSAMLGQNQTTCDNVIGSANYDIGHVYSTGGGGVAYLQSPCGSSKAGGVTGQGSPVGDPFDIDYVAHEMGHQWGGNHTQNNGCNRSSGAAYEPGSASTIMGYAGICSPNLQSNSDDHFNNHSYNEMYNFTVVGSGNGCAVATPSGNTPPSISVQTGGFFIPIGTPFELTATASDINDDALTFCWEQHDLGPSTSSGDANLTNPSGNAPIFRSWSPTTDGTRVFPRLGDVINGTSVIGELLPTYSRDLTFRCTVRDNAAGGGGVTDAEVAFEATDNAGPFLVTAPNSSVTWTGNSSQVVTWNVANTNAAPVNCSNVDIYLSTDGGWTYPYLIAGNEVNDGSALVVLPNVPTTTARIKVKGADNIFFDISNQNFSIIPGVVYDLDAAIVSINEPSGDICGTEINPEIVISNAGATTLTSMVIDYYLAGGGNGSVNWTGSLATGANEVVSLPTLSVSGGSQSYEVTLLNPNGSADENNVNNSIFQSFNVIELSGESVPVSNDFEGVNFPGIGWTLDNPDTDITWVSDDVTNDVDCNSSGVASINYYSYNDDGQTDDITSPSIDLQNAISPEVTFDYAYARYSATYFDRMQVQVLADCDPNWTTVWDKANLELATAGSTTSGYDPACGDWSSETIDLSAYVGSIIQVRFRGIAGYGNSLYLDNILIDAESVVTCPPGFYADGSTCTECPPGSYCPGDGNSYFCPAGTFQAVSGATECLACDAGSFADQIGSTSCELCPAGTYQATTGAVECINCAAGTISDPGATACYPCSPGYFVDGNECTECPPGSYCPGDGNSYFCPAGTFQAVSGATECLACDAGSFADQIGSTSCELCPAGTYQAITGAVECINCAAGTISDPGATACYPCSPGYFIDGNECTECPPGSYCPGDGNSYLCPPGTISGPGAEFCNSCPAGYFVDGNECTECPPGSYCPGDGNSYFCPAGTFQAVSGATECLACDAGSFADQIGSTSCELCPAGTYQATTGAVECINCAAGTISDPGATACYPCSPGYFIDGNECTECPPGSYCPGDGNSYLCPAGTISGPGAEFCNSCPAGYFVDGNECTECPPGSYCPGDGNSYFCPAGTFQAVSGAAECIACDAGSFADQIGSTSCELCPAGTYQATTGAVECINCAAGTISDPGATFCNSCPAGYFVDGNECTECPPGSYCPGDGNSYFCPAGTFQAVSGATECLACDAGSYSDQIGSTSCELCPAGTYQGESGAIECFDCAAGTVSDPGATFCTTCEAGEYDDGTTCAVCPPGLYCPGDGNSYLCPPGTISGPGAAACNSCPAGYFVDGNECIECPPGSYCPGDGNSYLCPAGTFQAVSGAVECILCADGTSSGPGATECEFVDCNGTTGGSAYEDECGVCDDNPNNDNETCEDCAGVPNGNAFIDDCGNCVGGTTGIDPCIPGCTSPTACNYQIDATIDDGSCIEPEADCYACNENNDGLDLIDDDDDGICNADETSISGTYTESPDCDDKNVTIFIYEIGTTNLLQTVSTIAEGGVFNTALNVVPGNYDLYIKIAGYLSKGYSNQIVSADTDAFVIEGLQAGDINDNDGINVIDVSLLTASFGAIIGDLDYNAAADLDCSGGVNVLDFSMLNAGFGLSGEHAELLAD